VKGDLFIIGGKRGPVWLGRAFALRTNSLNPRHGVLLLSIYGETGDREFGAFDEGAELAQFVQGC
jgi:hypothetical protein